MSHRVVWGAVAAIVVLAAVIGGKEPTSAPLVPDLVLAQGNYKYTGVASCGSSSCHGSKKPKPEYPRMNENIIWETKDKHRKGYDTLLNEKPKAPGAKPPSQIAATMKLGKPETASKCLVCHALEVKPDQVALDPKTKQPKMDPKKEIELGVTCDSCHGPAEKWLDPHAEKGWTHEKSVAVGMYDTKNFLLRAEKCVSCHLHIEAEMVAAGHPDLLAFELDTFSAQMPPHWRDKGAFAPTKAWATGQVISLREAAKQLGDRAAGGASGALLTDALAKVQGHGTMVKTLMAVVDPGVAKSVEADVAALTDAVAKGDKGKITSTAKNLQGAMQTQAAKVAGREYDAAQTKKLMGDLAGSGDAIGAAGLRAAEQASMALDRLYSAYSKSPGQKADPAAGKALDAMFATLDDPKKFDGKAFSAAAKSFNDVVK